MHARPFLQRNKKDHHGSARLPVSNFPKNELTQPISIPPQLELHIPTLEHDVLDKVHVSGCARWNPKEQQEVRNVLREYADVFAKDDLDLGWTLVVKHEITLKEGAKPIKECYRRAHHSCIMRCKSTSRK